MCRRYALFRWSPELAALPGFPQELCAHWNLLPGAQVPMLREVAGQRRVDMARWGLTPAWLTDLSRTPAHARLETLGEQPMFREPLRSKRCLVPANGFFEWRGVRKRPYWVSAEQPVLFMAGLWEAYPVEGMEYLSLALITGQAGEQRRPLLLDEAAQAVWLAADSAAEALMRVLETSRPVLRERALAGLLNDPRLDGPECLTPA